jgi:hypothetical protein
VTKGLRILWTAATANNGLVSFKSLIWLRTKSTESTYKSIWLV